MQPQSEPNGRVESAGGTSDGRAGLVYVVSNDPVASGNAILGYRRDASGSLTPLSGSPFPTH